MRDINECTAEVFSRSEKRIKERRTRRRRILSCSTAFGLCLVMLAVLYPTGIKSTDDGGENHESHKENVTQSVDNTGVDGNGVCVLITTTTETVSESIPRIYTKIEVRNDSDDPTFCYTQTDESAIENVVSIIDKDGTFIDEEDKYGCSGDGSVGGVFEIDYDSRYVITLFTNDGQQSVYYLQGNVVTAADTAEENIISDNFVMVLAELLDLPQRSVENEKAN